jgi:hypothetical protein
VTDAVRIDASVRSLRRLFTDTNYLIDNYQREYAWSQDDVQILIDDLWEGFEGQNGRPAETFSRPGAARRRTSRIRRPGSSAESAARRSTSPARGLPWPPGTARMAPPPFSPLGYGLAAWLPAPVPRSRPWPSAAISLGASLARPCGQPALSNSPARAIPRPAIARA